jgi:hypothetical protein
MQPLRQPQPAAPAPPSALPSALQKRIATLLSSGVQQNIIAAAVGLSPGRLTQLIDADRGLQQAIAAEQGKAVDEELDKDKRLSQIELTILGRLPELVADSDSLREMTSTLATVNDIRRKRTAQAFDADNRGIGAGVQLFLSDIAAQRVEVTLTKDRAILQLGGQSVVPMPRARAEVFLNERHVQSSIAAPAAPAAPAAISVCDFDIDA